MLHAFLLSGDYLDLARAEIEYLLCLTNPRVMGRVLIYQGYVGENVRRLALTKEVVKVFSITSLDEINRSFEELAEYLSLTFCGKCCVRVKCFSPGSFGSETRGAGKSEADASTEINTEKIDKVAMERELGAILWKKGVKISVSSPDRIVRVYIFPDSTTIIGLLEFRLDTKQFSKRHPEKRPFFRPGVMLPKLCRALVNISTLKGVFLDPLCGTGGFVIEASLLGLRAVGVELYPDIAKGCRENLRYFSLSADVVCGNAAQLPLKDCSVDGIATDTPYYQSSKSLYSRDELLSKASEEFCRVLRVGGRAVVVTNCDCDFPSLKMLDEFRVRVHGSLTRRIYVLEKTGV